jgi:hypothetical protein
MAGERQLSDGNDAGTIIGQSASDLVAFHGATPVDQAAVVTNTSGTLGNTNAALTAVINALTSKGLLAAS